MNVYINLLHDDERRYQGLVSRKFILMISSGLGLGLVVMVSAFAVSGFLGSRQEWSTLQTRWVQTEPRYTKYLSQQKEQQRIKAVVGELNGWNHGRLPMRELLLEVQRVVSPLPIQFNRITVAGEFTLVQPPTPKPPPVDVTTSVTNAPPVKPPPPIPARRWHITISGRVFGENGHRDAVAFTEQLQNNSRLAELLESVRLENLTRLTGTERRDEQVFTIEGLTKLRKCE